MRYSHVYSLVGSSINTMSMRNRVNLKLFSHNNYMESNSGINEVFLNNCNFIDHMDLCIFLQKFIP